VHETRDAAGRPRGLQLAYSTPRGWLRPGRRIAVTAAPTSFGTLGYEITRRGSTVAVSFDVPERRPASLALRLRLPAGERIGTVRLDGVPFGHVDRSTGTIDLSGRSGALELAVTITGTPRSS